MSTRVRPLSLLGIAALLGALLPTLGQGQRDEEDPLPTSVLEVHMAERAVYHIALPAIRGDAALAAPASEAMDHDFRYSSCCRVIPSREFRADLEEEGLGIRRRAWTGIGAQGVVKGQVTAGEGGAVSLELRFYEVNRTDEPSVVRNYTGRPDELRRFVHQFDNLVLQAVTGRPGAFDTQIAFARRIGPGRKDVLVSDYDGANPVRVSPNNGISMLPNFAPGAIWFSRLTQFGMYLTNSTTSDRPIIESDGLNMGVVFCNDRLYFTSTRDGNSEIYSSTLDGSDIRRLTNHPAIDISPACSPRGEIAFVSSRHGNPQIFTMNGDGSNVRRATFRGYHNQTPNWCPNPDRRVIAFTGRDGAMDIFTLDLETRQYARLTQAQGQNKDPAWSPDCRMIAFHSTRSGGGIYLTNPQGFNQNRVAEGAAEQLRWSLSAFTP